MPTFITLDRAGGTVQCDATRRTITGLAVPYGTPARVAAGTVTFAAGSIRIPADPSRVKLLRSHNPDAAVGYATGLADADGGLHAVFSVAAGPAGDAALADAASGVYDGLSVGVDLDDAAWSALWDTGAVDATGDLREISLCAVPAYDDARVSSVTATRPTGRTPTVTLTTDAPPAAPDAPAAPAAAGGELATFTPPDPAVRLPEPPPAVRVAMESRRDHLTLRELARITAAVNRGEQPATMLQAALTDVTTTQWPTPPAYIAQLVALVTIGRPLVEAFTVGPLPATGQKVTYPTVNQRPAPNVVGTQKTQIPTGPVSLGAGETPVQTIAWGNDVSMQTIDRSDPDFLTLYFELCGEQYAQRCDLLAYTTIRAALVGTITGPDPIALILATAAAAAAGNRPVDTLVVSQDLVWAMAAALTADTTPLAMLPGSPLNLIPTPVVDPLLPAGTVIAGNKAAFRWWENPGAPAQLRAVNVSLLGYDLGIYGYAAFTVPTGLETSLALGELDTATRETG